jgi:hypothetical protein
VEPARNLRDHTGHELRIELAPVVMEYLQQLADRTAVEILHDQVVDAVDRAELLDMDDVGMTDLRADPGLVDEHLDEARLRDQARMDHLQRDEPGEAGRAVTARKVQRCHPAGAQLLHDLVFTEPAPRHRILATTSVLAS